MKQVFFMLVCLGWINLGYANTHASDIQQMIAQKEAFNLGFPKFFVFRGEMVRTTNTSYQAWSRDLEPSFGLIKKFLREELPSIQDHMADWARAYGKDHPEKLSLVHLNGEARQVHGFPEAHERYFPGHWVYLPGTTLTQAVDAETRIFPVDNAGIFKTEAYSHPSRSQTFPHDVVIVPVNGDGTRQWTRAEFGRVEQMDAHAKTVTLKRGLHGTRARTHRVGEYVAPPAAGVWGGAPMWFYNLSSVCPRDARGQQASDVLVQELAELFGLAGHLRGFDGIGFDVNYWQARSSNWDVNNDGQSDGGIINGRNVWREGDWRFLCDLRTVLGEAVVITGDGHHLRNQRAVGILDGIESEGLVQHNDGYRGFSRFVNLHTYWHQYNPRPFDFRYVVLKLKNSADASRSDQLRRLAMGAATCLEAGFTRSVSGGDKTLPEMVRGADQELGWLGESTGPLIRLAQQAPDLLQGDGQRMTGGFIRGIVTKNCTMAINDLRELVFAGTATSPLTASELTFTNLFVPAGDLTIYLDIMMTDPLSGFVQDLPVPRAVSATLSPLPDYAEGKNNQALYGEMFGFAGTQGWSRLSFYFRALPRGEVDFELHIEEQGGFKIRNVSVHAAPAALARQFAGGVVLVNPSFMSVAFDLQTLFSQEKRLRYLPTVPGEPGEVAPDRVDVDGLDSVFLVSGD